MSEHDETTRKNTPRKLRCSGSGRPVFVDIGLVAKCKVCGQAVKCDAIFNAMEHADA